MLGICQSEVFQGLRIKPAAENQNSIATGVVDQRQRADVLQRNELIGNEFHVLPAFLLFGLLQVEEQHVSSLFELLLVRNRLPAYAVDARASLRDVNAAHGAPFPREFR